MKHTNGETKKERIKNEACVSDIVDDFLTEFETAEVTFRFADISAKRSEYNRKIDEAFFLHAKESLEKLAKLVVLINAHEMYHLHEYRKAILKHKAEIKNIYEKIKDCRL